MHCTQILQLIIFNEQIVYFESDKILTTNMEKILKHMSLLFIKTTFSGVLNTKHKSQNTLPVYRYCNKKN